MALFAPVHGSSVESRKRKGNNELTCRGVPLPYLIRPRKKLPLLDGYAFYNEYLEYSYINDGTDSESDDDDSAMKAVETSSLKKGNCFGLVNESDAILSDLGFSSDEEYVVVDNVEALPETKTERAGAIQMKELSKDAVDESGSEDEGSNSDDWVVV